MACVTVVATLLVVGAPVLAVTEVGGLIASDTTWDLAGSPYLVTLDAGGSIMVGFGATLTIEPGVEVRLKHDMGLTVGHTGFGPGTLVARGTEASPISFTTNAPYEPGPNPPPPAPGDWVRIYFTDYATDAEYDALGHYLTGCVLEHVIVEYAGDGGPAITASSCSPYLGHCEVQHSAERGIYVDAASAPTVRIESCDVSHCSTSGAGGGVLVTIEEMGTVRIEGCEVSHCAATGSGGGISVHGGNRYVVSGNTVRDCHAGPQKDVYGGGIYVSASNCTFEHNTVEDNSLTSSTSGDNPHGYGGGVHIQAECTVTDNTITGNTASISGNDNLYAYGGGFYINGACTLTHNTMSGNTLSSSGAGNSWRHYVYGGGLYINGTSTLTDNSITGNTASSSASYSDVRAYGGGLYINGPSTLTENSITGNTASSSANYDDVRAYGGGLYINGACTLTENSVSGNTASTSGRYELYANGGGILVEGDCTLTGNTVTGNAASSWAGHDRHYSFGGGICIGGASILTGNRVTANSASVSGDDYLCVYGGGVSANGMCTMEGNHVIGNSATASGTGQDQRAYGGGIRLGPDCDGSVVTGNDICDNIVQSDEDRGYGGGIYLYYSPNCEFTSNRITGNIGDKHGGGICVDHGSGFQLTSNTITQNTAGNYGGALYLYQSEGSVLTWNVVTENTADLEGGGMHFDQSGSCTMTDCAVAHNHTNAGDTGGIYVYESTWMSFAGDPVTGSYNVIKDNDGYYIYNDTAFDPAGSGDIDASYLQWGTDDMQAIQDCIYDYFDNANLGFVLFYPLWEDPELWRWPRAAVSRKTHGALGDFDIELPLAPAAPEDTAIETRRDGVQQVVLTFTEPIEAIDGTPDDTEVALTCDGSPCGSVDAVTIVGQVMTIDISGVPDATCLAITVSGIADLVGNPLVGDHDVQVVVLAADVNSDGNADLIDMAYVKSKNGEPLSPLPCDDPDFARFDLNVDGNIDLIDMALAKSRNGNSAACP